MNSDQELLDAIVREIKVLKNNANIMNESIGHKKLMIQERLKRLREQHQELQAEKDRGIQQKNELEAELHRLQFKYTTLQLEMTRTQRALNMPTAGNGQPQQSNIANEDLKNRVQQLSSFLNVNGPLMQEVNSLRQAHTEVRRSLSELLQDINLIEKNVNRETDLAIEEQLKAKTIINNRADESHTNIYGYRFMMNKICSATENNEYIYMDKVAKLYKIVNWTRSNLCQQIIAKQQLFKNYVQKICGSEQNLIQILSPISPQEILAVPIPLFVQVNGFCLNVLDLYDKWKNESLVDEFSWKNKKLSKDAVTVALIRLHDICLIVEDFENLPIIERLKNRNANLSEIY